MTSIRESRITTSLVTLLAALVLFGALAVSYDVSTSDGGGAVAEASHGSGPVQDHFDGCHHFDAYVDIWYGGLKWRSSQFDGPSWFNTNIYHHSASQGWVWHDSRGYTQTGCMIMEGRS